MMIDNDSRPITETFIKDLHRTLKNGTTDSRQDWLAVGDYKKRLNTVGGLFTAQPAEVAEKIRILIAAYNAKKEKSFDDLLDFHYRFERIHPFQDGGRLLLF